MKLIRKIILNAKEWDIVVMIEEDLSLDQVNDVDVCAFDTFVRAMCTSLLRGWEFNILGWEWSGLLPLIEYCIFLIYGSGRWGEACILGENVSKRS